MSRCFLLPRINVSAGKAMEEKWVFSKSSQRGHCATKSRAAGEFMLLLPSLSRWIT